MPTKSDLSRRAKAPVSPSVDARQVERLADLSRLSLAPHEAERLRGELSSILEYFAVLDRANSPAQATEAITVPNQPANAAAKTVARFSSIRTIHFINRKTR